MTLACICYGQYDAFNFQALILDENANRIANAQTTVQVTISKDIQQAEVYYKEEMALSSNANGSISFVIGSGNPITGTIEEVKWLEGVPYVQISYNLSDGKGWHQLPSKQFKSVPFCLRSKYVTCQRGVVGETGRQGAEGRQGPTGAIGASGATGQQGQAGVPIIESLSEAPLNAQIGRVYLDDGSQTQSGNPGFRYYDGSGWIDL